MGAKSTKLELRSHGSPGLARWPNLFILGVPKAGTRSLVSALTAHPQVYVPAHHQPRFFIDPEVDRRWAGFFDLVQREDKYLALFRGHDEAPYCCDASPEYMFSAEAMHRIRQVEPTSKAIVLLRDPVDRAYSHYLNDVREGLEKRTFLQAIREQLSGVDPQRWPSRYVHYGHYEQALRDASAIFKENLYVIFFEKLTSDPLTELSGLAEFLSLDFEGFHARGLRHLNEAAVPRGEISRHLLGSPLFRRLARAITPRRERPLFRRLFVSPKAVPPIDPQARGLLIREYAGEADAVAAVLGRHPAWRNFAA